MHSARLVFAFFVLFYFSLARGAEVTFTLTGGPSYSVYAEASPDSGGIFSFSVGLRGIVPVSGQIAAPGIYARNPLSGEIRELGFTGYHSAGGLGGTASQNSAAVPFTPIYGFGQEDGDLDNFRPPGFTDTSGTVGTGGAPYQKKLAVDFGTGDRGCPFFGSGNALVFVDRNSTQTVPANIRYRMVSTLCQPTMSLSLSAGGLLYPNRAVGGAIAITGSNSAYASEVNELTRDDSDGAAPIPGIGNEPGHIYVMAKLLGDPVAVDMIANSQTAIVDPSDPEAQSLHALYDEEFGPGGFNALLRYDNRPGAKVVYWHFEPSIGVTVDKLAVVPEPAALLIAVVLSLTLLRRQIT